mgnify:FL=1
MSVRVIQNPALRTEILNSLSDTAKRFNRHVQHEMKRLTPKRTGYTAENIHVLSVRREADGVRGTIEAPMTFLYLEVGTKAHRVEPRHARVLAWDISGTRRPGIPIGRALVSGRSMAFSRGHMVGGVRPRYIFERAVKTVLAEFRA